MTRAIAVSVILGFAVVDFLFFHDALKPGEVITLPQYLTGALSLLVVALAVQTLRGGTDGVPRPPTCESEARSCDAPAL